MVRKIKSGVTRFPEVVVKPAELHKVRGYFSTRYKRYDLLHNHDRETGKSIYRYPAIQFKINESLAIFAYKQEGIDILKEVFLTSEDIIIEGRRIEVFGKEIEVKEVEYGEDGEMYVYEFITPWLALNQENYRDYRVLGEKERGGKLNSIIINNIISFCKFAGYTIRNRLTVKSKFRELDANLKGVTHRAFRGEFMVNFCCLIIWGWENHPAAVTAI